MFAAFALLLVVVVWRVASGFTHGHDFGWLHNFAPLSAVALCGAAFLPRRLAFALPLGALLISDLLLNWHYGFPQVSWEMAARYVALGAIAWGGLALRARPTAGRLLGASAAGSVVFYLVSNTGSWLTQTQPAYAKTFAGLVQALTVGLPGYPPTWSFYRNTLLSDLLFTALFVACMAATKSTLPSAEQAPATTVA